jgi:hypothetical protein
VNGINPLKTKRKPLYLNTQSVPRSKHFLSWLYAVSGTSRCFFQINTKHISTVWAESTVVECQTGGASRNQEDLIG